MTCTIFAPATTAQLAFAIIRAAPAHADTRIVNKPNAIEAQSTFARIALPLSATANAKGKSMAATLIQRSTESNFLGIAYLPPNTSSLSLQRAFKSSMTRQFRVAA